MQRLKKPFIWLTLLVLIAGMFPVGAASTVHAADENSTSFFYPDDREILNTANYALSDIGNDSNLRTKVKVTNSPTIKITGTYSKVTGTTLTAQIDLLTWNSSKSTWEVDTVHSAPGTITADSSTRFTASNLTLFPGLNRITLKGKYGNVEAIETFFVLYDKIPYFTKLMIAGSGFLSDVSLNEGSRAVVKNPIIYLTGEVYNATKASISINGGEPLATDIYENTLTSNPLRLTPGLNKLSITFTNGSDSIQITRDVYYFNDTDPFVDIHVLDNNNGGKAYDLLNSTPTLKTGTTPNDLVIQMLVPYSASANSFESDSKITVDGTEYTPEMLPPNLYNDNQQFEVPTTGDTEEVIIEDSTGPVYRLVTFKLNGVALQTDASGVKAKQSPRIVVNYGEKDATAGTWNYTVNKTREYYLSNQTKISNIIYLPQYKDTDNGDVSKTSQIPLKGATLSSGDFYIMVETESAVTGNLTGKYLPLGTKDITISNPGVQAKVPDASEPTGFKNLTNTFIYKVSGLAKGEQNLRFQYDNAGTKTSQPYDASVSYTSIMGILVDNLIDGQSYSFNSKDNNGIGNIVITGEYYGFDLSTEDKLKEANPEYFVNGRNLLQEIKNGTEADTLGEDPYLIPDATDNNTAPYSAKFKLDLNISAKSGPFVAGENTIEFRGQYRDAAGNLVPISKKLRIYVIDENVANISVFQPGKTPTNLITEPRAPFPTLDEFNVPSDDAGRPAVDQKIGKITTLPTEFTYKDEKYTTSQLNYDLVVRGSGATTINIMSGSNVIFTLPVPTDAEYKAGNYPESGTPKYYYEFIGNEDDFLLRLMDATQTAADGTVTYLGDLNFNNDSTGTHVYNLELINKTGARTNQRLEITREVAPYRLLAPVATVGEQIIVNKNFVRFDIEAEGATKVIIGKEEAMRRPEPDKPNRFTLDYVGLKPDKLNSIKIQIVRGDSTINDTINVYYTSDVGIDAQYMAEKPATKYQVFNKQLTLSFPKGTIMQSANMTNNRVTKYYPDTKLLFGIADPSDGVVERRNDYGVYIDKNTEIISNNNLLDTYKANFTSTAQTYNFTRVSNIFWISGGVGELGDKGSADYKPATNGLPPYSTEGFFTSFEAEREIVPSQRGTLTISFDSNVVDEAGTLITVFKYTDVGGRGQWSRVPAEINTKAHTATIPFDEFGYYAVYKLSRSYTDITNHPWARNILNGLYSKGIMENLRADAFGADDQTTRGEFATLLVKGLSLPINADSSRQTFFDVPYGAKTATWDYEHLETAARAGIITGRTEGFFSPNMPITRQDAAVMIARALKLKLALNDDKLANSLAKSFLDYGQIDYYARPAVQAVVSAKIMSGSPITLPGAKKPSYNFNPGSYMTRAEAGKVTVELLKKSTSLFPKNFS
ncbi:hypothetical protein POTG_01043 [Paenibacillus sp. oral taxon 786 str. D14]|uniref:S-layer homology domain-containing protein n=1 Tax=Paenibacillus sp. oral taxon 786 TaxID=652715 RepID=UPI0001AFCFB5|nr:S-layer homology domain-containing protein [Paenibacillus sp. oral taxon 786]EES74763.1 hypothetical protein POTG_01043 [Paenibacillus sp. oral taxon 786 str. D14]